MKKLQYKCTTYSKYIHLSQHQPQLMRGNMGSRLTNL